MSKFKHRHRRTLNRDREFVEFATDPFHVRGNIFSLIVGTAVSVVTNIVTGKWFR